MRVLVLSIVYCPSLFSVCVLCWRVSSVGAVLHVVACFFLLFVSSACSPSWLVPSVRFRAVELVGFRSVWHECVLVASGFLCFLSLCVFVRFVFGYDCICVRSRVLPCAYMLDCVCVGSIHAAIGNETC